MKLESWRLVVVLTAEDFREKVTEQVCAAGGDAVITQINGYGCYIRGVVVRFASANPAR